MAWCSMTSAASRIAKSVSCPRGSASPRPSMRLSTAGTPPAARAIRTTNRRLPSRTQLLRLDPEVDHRELTRGVDQVPSQHRDGAGVSERGQAFGVGVDELLLRLAKSGQREV